METKLPIIGLSGGAKLRYDPNYTYNPTPTIPGLYPTYPSTTTTPSSVTKKKRNTMDTVTKITELLLKTGMTVAQVKSMWDGKQPVIINNPSTKEAVDVKKELEKQAVAEGKSNAEMMQMVMTMMQQRQQPVQKKDNTLLYVGIVFGVLAIGGTVYFLATKNKKKQ